MRRSTVAISGGLQGTYWDWSEVPKAGRSSWGVGRRGHCGFGPRGDRRARRGDVPCTRVTRQSPCLPRHTQRCPLGRRPAAPGPDLPLRPWPFLLLSRGRDMAVHLSTSLSPPPSLGCLRDLMLGSEWASPAGATASITVRWGQHTPMPRAFPFGHSEPRTFISWS